MLFISVIIFLVEISVLYGAGVPPEILVHPEERVYTYEERVTLHCLASGWPQVEYVWKKDGRPVDLHQDNIETDGAGTLSFNPATSSDEGYYQCLATNPHGTAMSRMGVLRRAVLVPFPQTDIREYRAMEGMPFTLPCMYTESFPDSQILWFLADEDHDRNPEELELDERVQMDSDGNLYFSNIQTTDEQEGKIYMCVWMNKFLRSMVTGSNARITVTPGSSSQSKPEIMASSTSNVVAVKGGDVELKCIFSGNPTPAVTWTRLYGDLNIGRHEVFQFGTELVIRDVQVGDEDIYLCTGENVEGTAVRRFEVRVNAAPEFVSPLRQPQSVNKTDGETASFVCDAMADPPAEVQWFINAQPIQDVPPSPNRVISNNGRLLTINNVCGSCGGGHSDTMVIQCNATNIHGYVLGQGYLNVV